MYIKENNNRPSSVSPKPFSINITKPGINVTLKKTQIFDKTQVFELVLGKAKLHLL